MVTRTFRWYNDILLFYMFRSSPLKLVDRSTRSYISTIKNGSRFFSYFSLSYQPGNVLKINFTSMVSFIDSIIIKVISGLNKRRILDIIVFIFFVAWKTRHVIIRS